MVSREEVIEMLETVEDPEIGLDIWTMGLVYDIDIKNDDEVDITMTYTSPMCPLGEEIKEDVTQSLKLLKFKKVIIKVTFEPPWKPSEELRVALGV